MHAIMSHRVGDKETVLWPNAFGTLVATIEAINNHRRAELSSDKAWELDVPDAIEEFGETLELDVGGRLALWDSRTNTSYIIQKVECNG